MMRTLACAAVWLLLSPLVLLAQEPQPPEKQPTPVPDREKLFKQFEESLRGAKLVGQFTVFGKEDEPGKKEEYTIRRVTKLDEGDFWLFHARIKYGDKDVLLPLPLEVKWAGDTPVITLTDFEIPSMGTFTARVMIYRDTYAGWWQHGEVGGHMFGKIEKIEQ